MSLRLFVLRHGETEFSRDYRFAGSRDVPLTVEGRRQFEAVAQALAGMPASAIVASPLERARVSAEIVAKRLGREVVLDPRVAEMAFGAWEGLTRDEVATRDPEGWHTWRNTPERFAAPGGESLPEVAARAGAAIDALRAAHDGQSVILVTHAVVTRLIILRALGLGPGRLWSVDASPAGLSELEYRDDWVTLHRVNTQAHLDGIGP